MAAYTSRIGTGYNKEPEMAVFLKSENCGIEHLSSTDRKQHIISACCLSLPEKNVQLTMAVESPSLNYFDYSRL